MMRIALWQIFFIVLPFILYWGYVVLVAKKRSDSGGTWNDAPITWLLAAGILMAVASLFYWGLSRELDDDVAMDALRSGAMTALRQPEQDPNNAN